MANMLRKHSRNWGDFGCCDHCARHSKPTRKPGPRERRLARARENREVRREVDSQR